MKIAVYSLTRERLEYTKVCFASLHEKAGANFDHFVIDNGSDDGTVKWLMTEYKDKAKKIILLEENLGISRASNIALDHMGVDNYDLIIKFDNDCFVITTNILDQLAEVFRYCFDKFILSPYVKGINNQPHRGRSIELGGKNIGLTAIVGGLFHCVPSSIYKKYRYPENLPLAKGQDDHFCDWAKTKNGCEVGYVENLIVEHYKGTNTQAIEYPAYFRRKAKEEVFIPV